jgi:predicted DNA repair protein MutK
MSVGLIALLDDIAALAKAAAASLDDVAAQATKAGTKAAGVVIDDAAVTPRYVTGFSAQRELPIVGKIALGSLKNKMLFLLPAALALSLLLPQAIIPLLVIGGLYLCYEGAEKVFEFVFPHAAHEHEAAVESIDIDPRSFEDEKVASAIRTDFILSAEIMAITLGSVSQASVWMQGVVLGVVGLMITVAVYGAVALIVKADDFGVKLASLKSRSAIAALGRAFGRGLVKAMPYFLKALGVVGTAAMIWVGGGIVLHGLEKAGLAGPSHVLHDAGAAAARAVPALGGFVDWLVQAAGSGIAGLVIGALTIPVASHGISPLWGWIKSRLRRRKS